MKNLVKVIIMQYKMFRKYNIATVNKNKSSKCPYKTIDNNFSPLVYPRAAPRLPPPHERGLPQDAQVRRVNAAEHPPQIRGGKGGAPIRVSRPWRRHGFEKVISQT